MHLHLYNTFLDLLTIQSNLKHTFMQHYAIHLSMVDLETSINPKLHICGLRKKLEYMERSKTDKKPWEPRTFTLWVDSFNHLITSLLKLPKSVWKNIVVDCSYLKLKKKNKRGRQGDNWKERVLSQNKVKIETHTKGLKF